MATRAVARNFTNQALLQNKSKIQKFYEDKSVLVTGSTGFLGKVIVEKLLRSCPDVRQIYLLVREKNGHSPEERFSRLVNDPVFSRVKKENPQYTKKIALVYGDLMKPQLGLKSSYEDLLKEHVDVVLNVAANIKFNEHLRIPVTSHVAAAKSLCQLAQKMSNLKAFVHVSTAFAHCDLTYTPERVIPAPVPPDNLLQLMDILDDRTIDRIAPSLVKSKQNTYIFTKCVAEEVFNNFRTSLPMAIIRPSIVIGAYHEPFPGWFDSINGPNVLAGLVTKGVLRVVVCRDQAQASMVPVDYVANGTLALAYTVANGQWKPPTEEGSQLPRESYSQMIPEGDVPVVNMVSASSNVMSWRRYYDLLVKYNLSSPSAKLLWYPFVITTQNKFNTRFQGTMLHHLPAVLVDFFMAKKNDNASLRKAYKYLDMFFDAMRYFTIRTVEYEDKNARAMWKMLEPQDQKLFPFNMEDVQWDEYMKNYVLGSRQFFLKEDPATIKRSSQRLQILYAIHLVTKGTLFLGFPLGILYSIT